MGRKIGIIMNGLTGRMGTNQHLVRSILAIRDQGGVVLPNRDRVIPDPILVGRNEEKLAKLARAHSVGQYTTDLDSALSDDSAEIHFDSARTELRVAGVSRAIDAGNEIYCEKPTATTLDNALGLWKKADRAGVKNGIVQDKLWLPGMRKLNYLRESGFFGRILSVRGELGYWVFDGMHEKAQRPSLNYRAEDGGGMMIDMFCHWRYVIDNLFAPIVRLSALGAIHLPERRDESGKPYKCTADESAYGTFELEDGTVCQFNSSWNVRVRRDDLLTLQVDGTDGSAVAGLRDCYIQPDASTPKPLWNPDLESPLNYFDDWTRMPDRNVWDNAFKVQWELFILHVVSDLPFRWNLLEGAKGVQLAELGMKSWKERKRVDVSTLS